MGGGGGSSSNVIPYTMPENPYLNDLVRFVGSLESQTTPMRESFSKDYFMPFLKGNYAPETMPGFAPGYSTIRSNYENQYNTAKENIIGSTPRGGAMANALAQNEYLRAKNIGDATNQLTSGLVSDLWNKGYNTAWVTSPNQILAGDTAAVNAYNDMNKVNAAANMQAQQANAAMEAQAGQGKTSGLGLLGTGLGMTMGALAAPMTGGTSLMGTGLAGLGSGMSGLTGGKGNSGITSGLGGYSTLMGQATPLRW